MNENDEHAVLVKLCFDNVNKPTEAANLSISLQLIHCISSDTFCPVNRDESNCNVQGSSRGRPLRQVRILGHFK